MNKRGFTLIELLAVIVILTIISLIAIPVITNIIEKAKKGAAESSALGYLNAIENQVAINSIDTSKEDIVDGIYEISELSNMGVQVKGNKPVSGTVTITKGEVTACTLTIKKYKVTCLENGKVTSTLSNDFEINNNILYSWDKEYYTSFLEEETFGLINELNINTIYHSFEDLYINEEEFVADKILNKGFELYHLTGDSSWYKSPDDIKREVDNVYNYNIRKLKKIKGLVLDIEFYVLAEYQTNPDDVISKLLSTYKEIVTYAHNKNIEIIFCLPSWLDSYYLSELEELIKISDGISVMNYNQGVLLEGITKEVELAKKYNKKINNIAEFQKLDEDYVTYYDEGIDKAIEDWKIMDEHFKYKNLTFAFHHLNSLLELKKGYKTYKYTIKDSNSNIMVSERIYITLKSNNEVINFKTNSNSQGIVSIVLPKGNNYDVQPSLQNYEISNINNISTTQNVIENEIILGNKKQKYTIELYFHLIDSGVTKDFKNKKVVIYSKDIGEIFIRTTSEIYGHMAVDLSYGETYYIDIFDDNDYLISFNNENITGNISNEFKYNKSDGSYFAGDVYISSK